MDRKFLGRLATYLIGVAIGLALLGLMQLRKQPPPAATPGPADQRVPMSGSEVSESPTRSSE